MAIIEFPLYKSKLCRRIDELDWKTHRISKSQKILLKLLITKKQVTLEEVEKRFGTSTRRLTKLFSPFYKYELFYIDWDVPNDIHSFRLKTLKPLGIDYENLDAFGPDTIF